MAFHKLFFYKLKWLFIRSFKNKEEEEEEACAKEINLKKIP